MKRTMCRRCFGKEYLRCPFQSGFPFRWEFEKRCNEEGMTRHGKWMPVEPDSRGCTLRFACSVCDNFTTYYEDARDCDYDYCPNCGAKMDLEE